MTTGIATGSGATPLWDPPDALRIGAMGAILLFILIGAEPFLDGTASENAASRAGGNLVNQVLFLGMGALALAVLAWRGRAALRPLATPPILAMLGWICVSTAFSIEPAVSARRLISLFILFGGVVSVLVLARDARQFAGVLGGCVLAVLVLCYLGLVLVPDRAMHTALDVIEPEHAGSWRGVYAHKNGAGAAMGMFIFIGLFWAGMGQRLLGWSVVALAGLFLAFTFSKTSLAMTPAVLGLTWACTLARSRHWHRLVLLGPLALLLAMTVGSVMVPAIGSLIASLMSDPTYTGRTEIWAFALDNIAKRPITGFGYGAFWESVYYGGGADATTWVNRATDAHDGYLNTALESGLPGLALTIWWLVLAPLADLETRLRASARRAIDPLAMLFLRMWLFTLMVAVFEAVFYQATNALFFLLAVAVLGLRFAAGARVIGAAPR